MKIWFRGIGTSELSINGANGEFTQQQLRTLMERAYESPVVLAIAAHERVSEKLTVHRTEDLNAMVESADYIVWMSSSLCGKLLLNNGIAQVMERLGRASLVLLAERKPAPPLTRRYDGEVTSVACAGKLFREATGAVVNANDNVAFLLLYMVMRGDLREHPVVVEQVPLQARSYPALGKPTTTSITAHRGPEPYLRTALSSIFSMREQPSEVLIGLDEDDAKPYREMLDRDPSIRMYTANGSPHGPYVFRQFLAQEATSELLLSLDSDDACCLDRLSETRLVMERTGAAMVGCHELEMNEIDHVLRIYRFPLDVSAVLQDKSAEPTSSNANEPFLHATAVTRRSAYLAAGGVSTTRRIASDSQFLLRAHFTMKIANVDEFLYLRRVHRLALTVAAPTRNGNAERQALSAMWNADFRRIKEGAIRLEDSSLRKETGDRVIMRRLTAPETEVVSRSRGFLLSR